MALVKARARNRADDELTPEEMAKRLRARVNAKRANANKKARELTSPKPRRVRLPGTSQPAVYTYVVWINGVPHLTPDLPLKRIVWNTRIILDKFVMQGAISQDEMETRIEQAKDLVHSVASRDTPDKEEDLLSYPNDPRQVLMQFVPEHERDIVPVIAPPICGSLEYHRMHERKRREAKRVARLASST